MAAIRYEKFQPLQNARLALNYLVSMVDEKFDYLPYWRVAPHENPAFAEHCRVDDAEIVASWYEAIDAVRSMLKTDEGAEVEKAFYRHLMKSWGEHGLRFHEKYPWTKTMHSSFHEMGYILSALVRIMQNDPEDKKARSRARGLVKGMRSLVISRQKVVFWSGDFPIEEPIYEFPNDIYIQSKGFDLSCHTGRGEQAIRNAVIMLPLVQYWELTGDEVALDLAQGTANYLLGPSRYFNYKMEFFGHVHSAVWFAAGLVRLGRLTKNTMYIEKGQAVYDYVRSLSSSFGWVPEYAQWKPFSEEHSETCCIRDMILCALELVDCGLEHYWNDVNLFARNQLVENQVKSGSFVGVDNSIPDTVERTYRDIDKRVAGGFSGGSEPNSISLTRFRSIAGCCVGFAPTALRATWERSIEYARGRITVNIPLDKKTRQAEVLIGYPNEGLICVTPRRKCDVAIRIYPWMGKKIEGAVNGRKKAFTREGDLAVFTDVPRGATLKFMHPIRMKKVRERVRDENYTVVWKGCDVVDLLPHGKPLRLYQRVEGAKKVYPKAPTQPTSGKGFVAAPTQQKR